MADSETTPYELLGGEAGVRALVTRFYDAMDQHEPQLSAIHECDSAGRVSQQMRDRFALFMIGWLGGPQDYTKAHGHPRLRMRHNKVIVNTATRDAWLRAMSRALDETGVDGELRAFLDARFAQVAEMMRNSPE